MQELALELNNLEHNFKCHFCLECDGYGCIGELPGMGGFNDNINFQKNCEGWNEIANLLIEQGVDFSDEVTIISAFFLFIALTSPK